MRSFYSILFLLCNDNSAETATMRRNVVRKKQTRQFNYFINYIFNYLVIWVKIYISMVIIIKLIHKIRINLKNLLCITIAMEYNI